MALYCFLFIVYKLELVGPCFLCLCSLGWLNLMIRSGKSCTKVTFSCHLSLIKLHLSKTVGPTSCVMLYHQSQFLMDIFLLRFTHETSKRGEQGHKNTYGKKMTLFTIDMSFCDIWTCMESHPRAQGHTLSVIHKYYKKKTFPDHHHNLNLNKNTKLYLQLSIQSLIYSINLHHTPHRSYCKYAYNTKLFWRTLFEKFKLAF